GEERIRSAFDHVAVPAQRVDPTAQSVGAFQQGDPDRTTQPFGEPVQVKSGAEPGYPAAQHRDPERLSRHGNPSSAACTQSAKTRMKRGSSFSISIRSRRMPFSSAKRLASMSTS